MSDEEEYDANFMGIHFEGTGAVWKSIYGDPVEFVEKVIPIALQEGKPGLTHFNKTINCEVTPFYYPKVGKMQVSSLVVSEEKSHVFYSCFPLMEGKENSLTISHHHTWSNGIEGVVAVSYDDNASPFSFFATDYYCSSERYAQSRKRDVSISALAYLLKKSEVTEIPVTEGDMYDVFLQKYLEENPDKTKEDFATPTVLLKGVRILFPSHYVCEWEFRFPVLAVEETEFLGIRFLRIEADFAGDEDNLISGYLYASPTALGDYYPKIGDDIEGILWMTGRLLPEK